ncbi:MAG: hypothetical protein GWO19_10305 [Nitrospinaceae bacterium]|nr:hypothetical protein [Nitrospinaceae bacterium]NIS87632.1 hypothetical protein [Nitrospinaceae bacterium]NIU46689.1 hypothetical protein [Nitrospinaceae bacterium]NIU98883.1 hypothetical protein [Nitrospinaceae bacterium]NIW61437.1 hypothetical protein [Nitrospinaceae bacterium]
MSWIDIAIPGGVGLLLILRPESMFIGAKVEPDEKRIRLLRRCGIGLTAIAAMFLLVKLIDPLMR